MPIKILFANHVGDFHSGGAERVLTNILLHLDPVQYRIFLAVPESQNGEVVETIPSHVRRFEHYIPLTRYEYPTFVRLLLSILLYPMEVLRLYALTWNSQIEVLYANSLISGVYLATVAKLTGRPLIYHEHNLVEQRKGCVWRVSLQWVTTTAVKVVAISSAVENSLEIHGVAPGKIHVIHNGIVGYPPNAEDLEEMRSRGRYRLSFKDEPVVGMVANLHQWKGHATFLHAIREVKGIFPRVKGVLVGRPIDESYFQRLQELVRELDVEPNVFFTGFQTNVEELMAAMDVVVVASENEPFGLVVLEAMWLQKPVVATKAGGPREIILDSVSGILFEPGNVSELSASIIKLLSSPSLRHSMGQEAVSRALRHFSIRCQTEAVEALIIGTTE